MRFIADLHIHSKILAGNERWHDAGKHLEMGPAQGISVVGTGDYTHPKWFKELNDKLEPLGNGLFKLKKAYQNVEVPALCSGEVSFLLTTEISCIYSKDNKTRKVHCLVFVRVFRAPPS